MDASELKDEIIQRIIHQGDSFLVLNKPSGFETIVKDGGNTKFCLTSILRRAIGKDVYPCHRLDRGTTGCQIFALNDDILSFFEDLFKEKTINKLYLGLCLGDFENNKGTINQSLSKWSGGKSPVKIASKKDRDSLSAKTAYRVISTADVVDGNPPEMTMVSFKLFTGRTHQIRVHSQFINHPLAGDNQYGDRPVNQFLKKKLRSSRPALHAWKLSFTCPETNKNITAQSPIPSDIKQVLNSYFSTWKKDLFGS